MGSHDLTCSRVHVRLIYFIAAFRPPSATGLAASSIGLEADAASIRNFEPIVVPGLLQTADYARETFRNGPIELDPDEVERLIEVRQARQEVLARDDRLRLWVVIDEAVIHRVVGGRWGDARAASALGRVRAAG